MSVRSDLWARVTSDQLGGQVSFATLLLSYPALVALALWPNAPAFAAVAVLSYAAEAAAFRLANPMVTRLSHIQLGVTLRFALREVALLLLLIRMGSGMTGWFALLTLALVTLHGVRGVHSALLVYTYRRRRLPVVTRRIDLSRLRIPDAPPRLIAPENMRTTLYLDALPVAGALVTALTGVSWVAPAGGAAGLAVGLLLTLALLPHTLRARKLPGTQQVMNVVNEQLRKLRPEVVLYFSGSLESAYQINMWLSTIDGLDRSTLIILRERGLLPLLARTTSPVLCVPATQDLPLLDLSSVRVAIYSANAGKNLHMLRLPGIKSVFVNHGDSDKAASFNPFSKVYDQVWVAGPAGRDRYLRADVGIRDEEIVEVGRPQLAPIRTGLDTPDPMFTVLYAPTWEGWTGDPYHTSVALMGPRIVRALLDHLPNIRLLYKPHPLTGKDKAAVRRANEKIIAMIHRANKMRDASGEWADAGDRALAEQARARLEELTVELAALTDPDAAQRAGARTRKGSGPGRLPAWLGACADEAQLSRDSAFVDPGEDRRFTEVSAAWNEAYWASEGWWRHRVITGRNPHLYDCFNRCDLLITDISSVVADFIASGKPYAVTNPGGVPPEEFIEQNPSVAGGFLIGRDCMELPDILTEVEKEGPDRLAERRRELKTYLLGPDEPDARTRFAAAVDALVEPRSEAERSRNGSASRAADATDVSGGTGTSAGTGTSGVQDAAARAASDHAGEAGGTPAGTAHAGDAAAPSATSAAASSDER